MKYVENSEALKPALHAHLLNLAVLALAEHQPRHTEKSQLALRELSQGLTQEWPASWNVDHDQQIAEILYKEAAAKINGKQELRPAAQPNANPQNDDEER